MVLEKNNYNFQTLNSYNENIQADIEGTPKEVTGEVKVWLDSCLSRLPTEARILEIGCGFGRDAEYIESLGYKVERTDAAEGFVAYMKGQNTDVRVLNILTDEIPKVYDMIFADAVFLHFTIDEFDVAVSKVYSALNECGLLGLTLKKGSGEEWTDAKLDAPRFFHYWEKEEITQKLTEIGFNEVTISNQDSKWYHIIAKNNLKKV